MLVVISATKTGGQRRQFPPGPWVRTRPVLRRGRVHTLVDPTKFWQGDEISNRYFCHVSWHFGHCIPFQPIKRLADLFSGPSLRLTHLARCLLLLTYRNRQPEEQQQYYYIREQWQHYKPLRSGHAKLYNWIESIDIDNLTDIIWPTALLVILLVQFNNERHAAREYCCSCSWRAKTKQNL